MSCMAPILAPMSAAAFAVWVASAFTSWATIEKPRPASPARAASIVAFKARRLVCAATPVMRPITSPISLPSRPRSATVWFAASAWPTARLASSEDWLALAPIAAIVSASSPPAAATAETVWLVCPDACAAAVVRCSA